MEEALNPTVKTNWDEFVSKAVIDLSEMTRRVLELEKQLDSSPKGFFATATCMLFHSNYEYVDMTDDGSYTEWKCLECGRKGFYMVM